MEKLDVRRGVLLIMAMFCLQPMAIGCWLALIPYVKETLGLSKLDLALALLGMPAALLIALQFAGGAVAKVGVRKLFLIAFPLQCATAFLPLLAGSQAMLFFALAAFGCTHAFMEVGLNVYAGRIEKKVEAHVMNRCHGFWALGLMTGSFMAATFGAALTPVGVMAVVALISTVIGVVVASRLPKVGEEASKQSLPRRSLSALPRALPAIGAFMLMVTLTEGAMADWSAVYLSERLSSDVTDAGIAVAIFSAFMAAGRFMGDYLKRRFGALVLARGSVLLAIIGLLCLIVPLPLVFAFVGFALIGLGVAAGYPLGVSAVAALDDTYEAGNVALMSTCALAGFLIGPPVIGFLADTFSMRVALGAMIPGLLLCLVLATWLQPRDSAPSRTSEV